MKCEEIKMRFSIGEMSKMHNLSVQTLRYYERLDLIKPAYINEETGYRYYSIEQFIVLDLIKQCKLMGLSLEEISKLMKEEITPSRLLGILQQQKQSLEQKIEELTAAKKHMTFLEERIRDAMAQPMGTVSISYKEERHLVAYSYLSRNTEELEINLRKVLLELEQQEGILNSEIAFSAPVEEISKGQVVYDRILIYAESPQALKGGEQVILPEGTYLTLYYDDHYGDNLKYYEKLLKAAKKQDIILEGDFYEFSIMPKIDSGRKEKSLVELLIKIRIS